MTGAIKISRKAFFRVAGTSLAIFTFYLWDRLVQRQESMGEKHEIRRIKAPIAAGVTFYDDFYLVKSGDKALAFSTTCTHAGCILKQENNGRITCPCHGSQFDAASGKTLKGPAFKPLKALDCRFDGKGNEWVVKL